MTDSSARPLDALRVVVVEDSVADAELLTAMLELELPATEVGVASTLAEGLRLVEAPVDAVITDLSLPDADGFKALLALRAALPDSAVLVLTGRSDAESGMAAMLAGADDYLVKGTHDSLALSTALRYAVQRRNTQRNNRRFERLAQNLLDAMESPTCAVSRDGDIIAINRAWQSFTALGAHGSDIGTSYLALCEAAPAVDDTSMAAVIRGLQSVLAGAVSRFQYDFAAHADGGTQWFSLRINALPDAQGAVLTHVDVSVAKRAEQALAHQTMHDALTDLPNRELLAARLTQAMTDAAARGLLVGVGFLDLDQFKQINDSLGHAAGDELLTAVSQRLRKALRAADTLARFAGDEFVVIWPDLACSADAELLAERLRSVFDEPFRLQEATVSVSASIGVALGAAPQPPDELLLAADAAMYDAKGRGRGRTRLFTAELREGAESRLRAEAELRDALAEQQFELHYQPVVDLTRGAVRGVEALVRWAHPDGLRMPDSFIPVAEASGMIVPLGAWVLNEACRQAAEWQRQGLDLDLAVNLSVRQVSHFNIVETIREALASSGLEPDRLILEVTESVMLEDAEAAQLTLSRISELGARIAIDDFGTGYSSLLYLKRYPVRALKVDRSFVAGMGANKDDHAIVTSVVSLARAVGSDCIAEGVETEEQYAMLRAMGCDYAQGYLFGRPVPAAELPGSLGQCHVVLQQPTASPGRSAAPPDSRVEPFVLSRISMMHEAGASLHTIAAALNHERAPHPDGIRWHNAAVAQVIAGGYRPARRRTAPRSRSAVRRPAPVPAIRHRSLVYADGQQLEDEVCDSLSAALETSEAVLILASGPERAAIQAGLARRGHDLDAFSLTSQLRSWEADEVLGDLTVDGYISGRLFRKLVGERVETALARFGRAHVYGGLQGRLWERGDVSSALALESLWQKLSERLAFDLVCGFHHEALDAAGTDEDRGCLHQNHLHAA